MRTNWLFIFLLISIRFYGQAPWTDASGLAGPGSDTGYSIATDDSGNVYTAGIFGLTVDFEPGPGVYNLTSNGGEDIYLAKYTPSGTLIWAKSWGHNLYTEGNPELSLDSAGNIYISCTFRGTVDFDPGPGVYSVTGSPSTAGFCISKFDNTGIFIWAKAISYPGGNAACNGLASDPAGNIYFSGTIYNGIFDFDPGAGTFNLTSPGTIYYIFNAKYDPSGNLLWAHRIGSTITQEATGIVLDEINNTIQVTGLFKGIVDFDPGASVLNLDGNIGQTFILKLNSSGSLIWAKQFEGTGFSGARGIGVDSLGNVYIGGGFNNTVDFDPGVGTYDLTVPGPACCQTVYLAKLDALGNFVWAKHFFSDDAMSSDGFFTDASGNSYLCSGFKGTADFDPTALISSTTSEGQYDIFLSKFDPLGNLLWNYTIGNVGTEAGRAVSADVLGNVYATGMFASPVIMFGSTTLYNTDTSTHMGDVFLLKVCNNTSAVTISDSGSVLSSSMPYGNQWLLNGNVLPGDTNQTYTVTTNGIYSVIVTATTGCVSDTSNTITMISTGLYPEISKEEFLVFPNPFSQQLNVLFSEIQENTVIRILDMIGKEIRVVSFSGKTYSMERGTLAAGVYLLDIQSKDQQHTYKRIIAN